MESVMNIGQLSKWLILNSKKSNKEIVEIVKGQFAEAKTTESSVAWYRSDLRKKGLLAKKSEGLKLTEDQLKKLAE